MDELPIVEGLDTRDALTRLGGNRSLYLKLLHQFLEQESVPSQIAAQLNQGDRSTAERMAHTLKGVAGTLGATAVQRAAAELEESIRTGKNAVVEPLAVGLSELLTRLRPALPELSSRPAVPVNLEQKEEIVTQMEALLSCYDAGAQDLFESHRELFQTVLGDEDFRAFETHVSHFALDEAHQLLRQAVGS